MNPFALNEIQLDAIREISSIGMGHAATALSRLLGTQVDMVIPSVHCLRLSSVHDFVGGAEQPMAGIMLGMTGDASGLLMLLFPHDCALQLVASLTNGTTGTGFPLNELEASALKEAGNILASSYLNAIGALLKLTLLPSPPALSFDMAGAVLDPILSSQCAIGDTSLLVRVNFCAATPGVTGQFFMMPDPESLSIILRAAGAKHD